MRWGLMSKRSQLVCATLAYLICLVTLADLWLGLMPVPVNCVLFGVNGLLCVRLSGHLRAYCRGER